MTTELIQLTNQPKPDVVVTAISDVPIAVSGTSVTRAAVPRPDLNPRIQSLESTKSFSGR